MSARDTSFRAFGDWIQSHGGSLDASVMDVVTFPGQLGRGAIALKDIPVSSSCLLDSELFRSYPCLRLLGGIHTLHDTALANALCANVDPAKSPWAYQVAEL